jgi:hypothetical protein
LIAPAFSLLFRNISAYVPTEHNGIGINRLERLILGKADFFLILAMKVNWT